MASKKYDNDWKKRANEVLEKCDGVQVDAAKIMGVSQATLRQVINSDPSLKGRWISKKVNNQTMHRQEQPMTDAKALEKQSELMKSGLTSMGVDGKSQAEALAFYEFGQQSLGAARQLIGGGVVKLFSDLMTDINEIRHELSNGVDDERERVLREDKSSMIKHVLETYDRVNKAALTDAVVKQKIEERKGGGSKKKPGFTPVAIQINEPQEVKLTTQDNQDSKS